MGNSADMPADADAVLHRWNPEGADNLGRIRESAGGCAVAVVGAGIEKVVDALAGAVELTSSVADAAVVLVVLDAAAPLGRAALADIEQLAATANDVVFAMNGTDVHREWRTVAERDRAAIAARVPRLREVAIHPVATRSPTDAGVARLVDELRAAVGTAGTDSRTARLARATAAAGERARRRIAAQATTLRAASEVTTLRAERVRVVGRRDGGRTEATALLRGQIQLARVELLHEVGARTRAAAAAVRAELDRRDRAGVRAYPRRLAGVIGTLTAEVDAVVERRLDDLSVRVVGSAGPARSTAPALGIADGPPRRPRGIEDRMMIVLGASAGLGIGRFAVAPLSLVPALDIATIPVTLLLGGLAAWWLTRSRGHVADRAHMRQWATDVLVDVKAQLERRVAAALLWTEAEAGERILRATAARTAAVDAELAELDARLRQAGARNAAQLAACERDLTTLTRGLAAIGTEPRCAASDSSSTVLSGGSRTAEEAT